MTRVEMLRRIRARLDGMVNVQVVEDESELPTSYAGSYALLQPSSGTRSHSTMLAQHEALTAPWSVMYVGRTKRLVLDAAEQGDALLLNHDLDPSNPSSTLVQDDGVESPLISGGVAGDARVSLTRFYRLTTDRR